MIEPTPTPKIDFSSKMEPAPEMAPTRKSITKPAEAELIPRASATPKRAMPLGKDIREGKHQGEAVMAEAFRAPAAWMTRKIIKILSLRLARHCGLSCAACPVSIGP